MKSFGWSNVKSNFNGDKGSWATGPKGKTDGVPRGWLEAKKGENATGWTNNENWKGSPWLRK